MKAGGHEWFKPSPREQAQIDRMRRFVGGKIRKNISEGKSQKQATAIALNQARKKGFKVAPLPRHVRQAEKGRYR